MTKDAEETADSAAEDSPLDLSEIFEEGAGGDEESTDDSIDALLTTTQVAEGAPQGEESGGGRGQEGRSAQDQHWADVARRKDDALKASEARAAALEQQLANREALERRMEALEKGTAPKRGRFDFSNIDYSQLVTDAPAVLAQVANSAYEAATQDAERRFKDSPQVALLSAASVLQDMAAESPLVRRILSNPSTAAKVRAAAADPSRFERYGRDDKNAYKSIIFDIVSSEIESVARTRQTEEESRLAGHQREMAGAGSISASTGTPPIRRKITRDEFVDSADDSAFGEVLHGKILPNISDPEEGM